MVQKVDFFKKRHDIVWLLANSITETVRTEFRVWCFLAKVGLGSFTEKYLKLAFKKLHKLTRWRLNIVFILG